MMTNYKVVKAPANATAPAHTHAAVTPGDTAGANLSELPRGLYIGSAGDVVIVTDDDTAVTYVGVPAGTILPIAAKRVNSTNTTADDIVALF